MPTPADTKLLRDLARHGGVVRARDVFAAGVHPRTLYRLRDAGALEVLGRGVYRVASVTPPPHLDLLAVAVRVPAAVVCLVSALAFHDLTDEIPHEVMIAVPRGAARPVLDSPPVRVFQLSGRAYRLGIEHHRIDRIDLKVYSATKTVLDCLRFRNRIGEDVAIKALARGLQTRKVRPAALTEMARELRIASVLTPYLRALT